MNVTFRRLAVALSVAALVITQGFPAGAGGRATDAAPQGQPAHDYVTVRLVDPPTASYMGRIQNIPRTKPLPGRKLQLSSDAARMYRDYLATKRQDYKRFLQTRAPRAQVAREYSVVFNGLAVKLNGESLSALASGPGVAVVTNSFLVKPAMNISPALINAPALWGPLPGPPGNAGAGIKIGVIDTGIDITNPFMSDAGYTDIAELDFCQPFTKPGGANTNDKVFVCRVFHSGVAPGASAPSVLLAFDHGTHVAGTAAGKHNTDNATVAGTEVEIDNLSGIAPGALLGDYNVFPGFGAGFIAFGGSAFSHDIIAALEAAVADGMDVLNMSIGGGVQGPHDTLADAVNATVDAGLVAAVAAGNSGPGDATITSPGSAEKALTAGASTNPHFVGQQVGGVHAAGTVGGAVGDFNVFPTPPVTMSWLSFGSNLACTSSVPLPTADPQIAVIPRGVCTFTTKIRNAMDAGYDGVIVRNNTLGDPVAMAHDGTDPFPAIPAVMIQFGPLAGTSGTATAGGTLAEFISTNADIIARFSSHGPTPFTFLIKPDATAPGVNVLSSVFGGEFAFFQGTSMSTPHLAGSAALLLQLFQGTYGTSVALPYPDLIKSAIVNTAKRPVFNFAPPLTPLANAQVRGGGRVDLEDAMNTPAGLAPASVSYGLHRTPQAITQSRTVTIFNTITSSARTYAISAVDPEPGVDISVSVSSLTVAAGALGSFTVTVTIASTVPAGDYQGDIEVAFGLTTLRVPWWVRVERPGP